MKEGNPNREFILKEFKKDGYVGFSSPDSKKKYRNQDCLKFNNKFLKIWKPKDYDKR